MSAAQLQLLEAPGVVLPDVRILEAPQVQIARAPRPKPPKGATNEWFTLDTDFLPWMEEFRFTVDAYACAESHKVPLYWSKDRPAEQQDWTDHRVFHQPGYGRGHLARAMRFAASQSLRAELIFSLVPAWTDRLWWHEAVEPSLRSGLATVRFLKGRLRFGWPGAPLGHPRCPARFPSCCIIWRRP